MFKTVNGHISLVSPGCPKQIGHEGKPALSVDLADGHPPFIVHAEGASVNGVEVYPDGEWAPKWQELAEGTSPVKAEPVPLPSGPDSKPKPARKKAAAKKGGR